MVGVTRVFFLNITKIPVTDHVYLILVKVSGDRSESHSVCSNV